MADISQIKDSVNKIELSQNYLLNSKINKQSQAELLKILTEIAETPLTSADMYMERAKYMVQKNSSANKEKITIKLSLEEQKNNLEMLLSKIIAVIPQIETQLTSMGGKEYFSTEAEITDDETIRLRRPNKGRIGDRGVSHNEPKKIMYHKKDFTDNDIALLLQKIANIAKQSSILHKSIQNIEVLENMFAEANIQAAKGKAKDQKSKIMEVYTTINNQFSKNEIDGKLLEKKLNYGGKEHTKIQDKLAEKTFSAIKVNEITYEELEKNPQKFSSMFGLREKNELIKGKNILFTLPEIDDICTMSLEDTKDIQNPEYKTKLEELLLVATVIKDIAAILNS